MSKPSPTALSSSTYQSIFESALEAYRKRTKKDLASHPLLSKFESWDSPETILTTLREQIPEFDQALSGNDRLTRWLSPTVNVLCSFSGTFGGITSLAYPPTAVIFTGIGVLLSTVTAGGSRNDALIDLFERLETFFQRLEVYLEFPLSAAMTDIIVKIMVEFLSILAIATNEIKQSKPKTFLKKLAGKADIEDALRRLDKLTQDEVLMTATQALRTTQEVHDMAKVMNANVMNVSSEVQDVNDMIRVIGDSVTGVHNKITTWIEGSEETRGTIQREASGVGGVTRSMLRQDMRKWLCPADPSINYNAASDAHHEGTSVWLIEGTTYVNWKESGSLLWIYGKPGSGKSILCSAIIQDVERMSNAGLFKDLSIRQRMEGCKRLY